MKKRMSIAVALIAALAMVMTMSISVFAGGIGSNEAALKKALKNAGLSKSEVKRIETLYKTSRGLRQYTPMGEKDLQEMDAFTGYFIPFLTEQTRTIQQRYLKQRRVAQINAITANAIIPEEFKKVGLKAKVEGQKYRAKVLVSLNGTSVRFYVRYKDLGKEGIMDDVIKAVVDLKDALDRLGYGAVVKRI